MEQVNAYQVINFVHIKFFTDVCKLARYDPKRFKYYLSTICDEHV